jgi:aryl-alcohol dehydrogenase-like predicted oxidoreductase
LKSTDNLISIAERKVRRIGLGTNRLTDTPENQALLKNAISLGINFIDTANIYQGGRSEETIGNTLSPYSDDLVIATKGGMVRGAPANNDPEFLAKAIVESLVRLKTNCITLYHLHRMNPEASIKRTMSFFKQMLSEGKIKHIGLSEVSIEQIEEARKTAEVTTVQNHYNLAIRKHEAVVDYCEKNGIVFIPFFPLGTGNIPEKILSGIAAKYGSTIQQVSLAWLLKRSPAMLPIPGTLSIRHLEENLASEDIELNEDDFNKLNNING